MKMSVKAKSRDQIIIRTSIIGIAANIFLAGFKAFVGILSNSIAIVLDAVNNLSDALSSVIPSSAQNWPAGPRTRNTRWATAGSNI